MCTYTYTCTYTHTCAYTFNTRVRHAAVLTHPAWAVSRPRPRTSPRWRTARVRDRGARSSAKQSPLLRGAAGGRADVTGGVGAAPPLSAARLPPGCQGDGYNSAALRGRAAGRAAAMSQRQVLQGRPGWRRRRPGLGAEGWRGGL